MKKIALVLASALASVGAFADTTGAIDVTSTVSTISAQLTPIGLVGAAVLGVFVALKGYKWVRRAL